VSGVAVTLIDYGAGNLTSVLKGLRAAGAEVGIAASPDAIAGATALVVPGVGHFGATRSLDAARRAAIADALGRGVPVLGICLGLQLLFEGSDEAADLPGFGAFGGRCEALPNRVKVPHVGWNTIHHTGRRSRLLDGIDSDAFAYFTHSYAAPVVDATVATTTHGVSFTAVVERGPVFGVQFHPEKSGRTGLRLLENFVGVARAS
jgi:glutamine amidotransferase